MRLGSSPTYSSKHSTEMYSRRQNTISKKSCLRCRSQKRKCDRAFPKCSLCARLHQACTYDSPVSPPSPSASPDHESRFTSGHTPADIKADIVQRVSGFSPEDIAARYSSDLHPWFPIMSSSKILDELPLSWDDATVEFTLLCFTILLMTTEPEARQDIDGIPSSLKSVYFLSKSWCALLEAAGLNSLILVKSRLLITLFEVGHGVYPAAYISLGGVVRALDALTGYCGYSPPILGSAQGDMEEECRAEGAIAVVDRYITIENGKHPSLTRGRSFLGRQHLLEPNTTNHPMWNHKGSCSRLFEASSLLEKVHITLNEPLKQRSYNVEEVTMIVQTLQSFETVLKQELQEDSKLYSGAFILCQIAFVVAYDNGAKADPHDADYSRCPVGARIQLDRVLDDILIMIQPILAGEETLDFKILTPFLIYLVYKSAAIVTERLRIGEETILNCKNLKGFRDFLEILGQRWLAGKRCLKLLDEDTTPRMLKSIQ